MMDVFAMVFVVAILVEAQIQVMKSWVPEEVKVPGWLWPAISAALGVLVCVLAGVDVFNLLEIKLSAPMVGSVLSGVLISRGANFVHDLWSQLKDQA